MKRLRRLKIFTHALRIDPEQKSVSLFSFGISIRTTQGRMRLSWSWSGLGEVSLS